MKQKRSLLLSLLALVLILCALVQPAWAYFTCNSEANGAVTISFLRRTDITEEVDGLTKNVTIQNDPSSTVSVWVRARAYTGSQYSLNIGGTGWTAGADGWWYYGTPVAPGDSTAGLAVTLEATVPEGEELPTINVAVVYESTTAFYNADGSFKDADWNAVLDTGTSSAET